MKLTLATHHEDDMSENDQKLVKDLEDLRHYLFARGDRGDLRKNPALTYRKVAKLVDSVLMAHALRHGAKP